MSITTLSEHGCFGGGMGFYRHWSNVNNCDMQFAVFVPSQAVAGPVPVVTWLAGLTCSEETFMIKAGGQRIASELGIMLIAPDTSPRGENVPDDPEGSWDFGLGAGFYVNATETPWHQNYNMFDYVSKELPEVVANNFPADLDRQGIFGHSMGGHGALTIGLRNLDAYQSISAFSPICSPINCPWGQKALGNYLGGNQDDWAEYDSCEVIKSLQAMPSSPVLVDQGLDDQFLKDELHPHLLEEACKERGLDLKLRRHKGYDHGYYFISSFIEDHIRHHADILRA
ncbi:MAG: S-formylglutathione hydrolase [Woeseia sp.]|nr:S-formylglutathione hydrolase [Woeseia sp.]|tara:strand:+ start:540 stop:1391 length:852 start_codon:yes stop_codon:yes gene_type:complete